MQKLDAESLRTSLDAMRGKTILVLGDVMLDQYVFGDVERISPEAPVPVVNVRDERFMLGGAGNVAKNIQSLGGTPLLVSVCGDDEAGRSLTALLHDNAIECACQTSPYRPTTIKTRILAQNQQVVRVDRESREQLDAETNTRLTQSMLEAVSRCDGIIVSDYGKGLVTPALMSALRSAVAQRTPKPYILTDPKPVNADCYEEVDIITPNAKETAALSGVTPREKQDIVRAGLALFKRFRNKHLLMTLGGMGMALFIAPDTIYHIPAVARKVYDVTGAGDTVIATMSLALAGGLDLLTASYIANLAAGIVVGQVGTATVAPHDLFKAVEEFPEATVASWLVPNMTHRTLS
ncbi:D-glycero-beta-D-manno-heptose-7-phosphate kinase [Desulfovibrio inopinatus]|uniref:D-glycero-beta-D-manno-heptose-7-phosphate kinase n=1 Tax=Desulfovibrio inopinatus TaxID=102109 RepID=UPI000408BE6A|nr:D-glycero-beta-D-manno-heptose-7-phosphate kinase [Desulfovibrio inopinatus]